MAKIFLDAQFKIDKRKQQTEAKLIQALKQKWQDGTQFNQIDIKDLCESANVSRATFYRHHEGIEDVVFVQFLIAISEFEQKIDVLNRVNFENGSITIVDMIYANLDLFKMVKWSHMQIKVQALFSGTALKILISRDYSKEAKHFISDYLGTAILNFAQRVADAKEPITKAEALRLYRLLLPSRL
ncbi:hypothetical protein ADU72_0202 [Pediococcus damnosus]|uniref:HTH tetR-type domain-containing protein n=1 Tax=Pediococcus damnosus TaxID=51663 RepID=A0A0R2HI59_9LACO|nr:hypothetical protein [Pediococcus damnosus]AMV61969.1 hypothetical protein ADU70_0469 [Pediococcus damnosus]AMV66151.1 hypothetical protein ADU72_0202 [Pediococcus damnosus]AMV68436.1 hypothetical protein ADU73_0024 [Pediococcus damnosus]KJU74353.1 hypothetical protein AH70_07090 [Pediococcus damnosus LMG 28219]KRN52751.1 hypothetical protein IV84_GL000564 [Pediococcus damnosus]